MTRDSPRPLPLTLAGLGAPSGATSLVFLACLRQADSELLSQVAKPPPEHPGLPPPAAGSLWDSWVGKIRFRLRKEGARRSRAVLFRFARHSEDLGQGVELTTLRARELLAICPQSLSGMLPPPKKGGG